MEDPRIYNFLKTAEVAEALVIKKETVCELISYNHYFMPEKYLLFMEEIYDSSFREYLKILSQSNAFSSIFLRLIKNMLLKCQSEFIEIDSYLVHRKLIIKDKNKNIIPWEDLSDEVKQEISVYTYCQNEYIHKFISNFSTPDIENQNPIFKWNGTKTELVELANLLYKSGLLSIDRNKILKKEFIQQFTLLFGVTVEFPEKILSKATLRDNPLQFTDKLRSINTEYCESLLH